MKIPKLTTKHILELVILSIIKKDSCDGHQILGHLRKINLETPLGTLYPLLSVLRKSKIICVDWNEDAVPIRKCYELTDTGKARLDYLSKEWKRINTIISHLR